MITLRQDPAKPGFWTIRNGVSRWGPYSMPDEYEQMADKLRWIMLYRTSEGEKRAAREKRREAKGEA